MIHDIYDISEIKEQNGRLEDGLRSLKEAYQKPQMSEGQLEELRLKIKGAGMAEGKGRKKAWMARCTAAAALITVLAVLPNASTAAARTMVRIPVIGRLIEAVTIRDYKYASDKNMADIKVPELDVKDDRETGGKVRENLERSTKEINAEIQEITDKLVREFETNLENEGSHQDMTVDSEVLSTSSDYFTLKLICYQAAGSGYEQDHYYTIDLHTGERMQLKDIFKDGADYVTPISENIKKQMKDRMAADENAIYWLDSDIGEWDFQSITDQTSFYLNEKDRVVIAFNEGDVAPMYMGAVEFEIPAGALKHIRK